MKSFYQIFLIVLCFSFTACQAEARNEARDTECCALGPNPADSILSDEQLVDKFEKTTVRVKSSWRLINRETRQLVYQLYLPAKALAKAGVKNPAPAEEAVPVYVQKADGGYEPLLTDDAGQHNRAVGLDFAGFGSLVTSDGFILTSRRVTTGWKVNMDFVKNAPPGITMSADLQQVVNSVTPPPTDWIPENTVPRTGILGKFNVRVKSGKSFTGKNEFLTASLPGGTTPLKAALVLTSSRADVAVIKIDVARNMEKANLFDDYDALKKGENLFFVFVESSNKDLMQAKLAVMTMSINEFIPADGKTGEVITLTDNLENSTNGSKAKASEQRILFALGSYSGAPVYNNRGEIIGIYSNYKLDTNRYYVVPIRYAKELLNYNY